MIRCVLGEVDGLLVLGGQEVEQPEGLTWLALPGGAGEVRGAARVYWGTWPGRCSAAWLVSLSRDGGELKRASTLSPRC